MEHFGDTIKSAVETVLLFGITSGILYAVLKDSIAAFVSGLF